MFSKLDCSPAAAVSSSMVGRVGSVERLNPRGDLDREGTERGKYIKAIGLRRGIAREGVICPSAG
jgi:hypothetical protein